MISNRCLTMFVCVKGRSVNPEGEKAAEGEKKEDQGGQSGL